MPENRATLIGLVADHLDTMLDLNLKPSELYLTADELVTMIAASVAADKVVCEREHVLEPCRHESWEVVGSSRRCNDCMELLAPDHSVPHLCGHECSGEPLTKQERNVAHGVCG